MSPIELNLMYYLIYSSKESECTTELELKQIMEQSEKNNKRQNITGLLIYFHGTFIQMLEGTEKDVFETFGRIENDPRHEQIIKLLSGETDKRHFPNWKMALQVVNEETFKRIESYESLSEGDLFLQHISDDSIGLKMLRYFYEMSKGN